MGDEGTYPDSIWTPPSEPGAPDAPGGASPAEPAEPAAPPPPEPEPEAEVRPEAEAPSASAPPGPPPSEPAVGAPLAAAPAPAPARSGRRWGRIVVGVACLLLAVIVAVLVVTKDDQPAERVTGKAVSRTPRFPEGKGTTPEAVTTLLVPTTVAPGTEGGCGQWDTAYNFKPASLDQGVYIWSDFDGWHVRALGAGVGEVTGRVTGTVRPNLVHTSAERVEVTPAVDALALDFRITPGYDSKGFDFSAGCSQTQLRFDLQADGEPIDPTLVHLGSKGGVVAVPFQADRQPA